jgi:hypothetical protein
MGNWLSRPNQTAYCQYWIHHTKKFIINQSKITNKWYLHKICGEIYSKLTFDKDGKEYTTKVNFMDYVPVDIDEVKGVMTVDPRNVMSYDKSVYGTLFNPIEDLPNNLTEYISQCPSDILQLLTNITIIDDSY